jgi:hypothetical protein
MLFEAERALLLKVEHSEGSICDFAVYLSVLGHCVSYLCQNSHSALGMG